MSACDRCGASKAEAVIADSLDDTATVCADCGAGWLAAVVDDWDASLAIFVGRASLTERQAHAERVAAAQTAEQERERRTEERRAQARASNAAKKAERDRAAAERREAAEAERQELALRAARYVRTNGGVSLAALADALGLSRRTLSRALSISADRGWTASSRRGVEPGETAPPSDPRDELDATDARCRELSRA